VVVVGVAASSAARAERLKEPEASPAAEIQQTVGLSTIKVAYHRPAINGRPVWGALVPWGEVWRAGANENTTITFSSDVKVEGKPLKAGTYGLHMIPTQKDWTIIFSTMSVAWGSYSYDAKEDALRVTVKPRAVASSEERLAYRFDDPSMTKTTLVMSWEKIAVPIAIDVDTPKVVMASMRAELRGVSSFTWEGWAQAASYWLKNGGSLDEALKMADRSIGVQPAFGNLMVRAGIIEKQGKAAAAKETRDKAMAMASERELNTYGYQLMADKKVADAIALFKLIVDRFPDSWNARDSLGEALANSGDKPGAIAAYEKALALVKDATQKKRIEATLARLKQP
jgi:hypothetical protein